MGDGFSLAGVPGVVRGKNGGSRAPGRTAGAHLRQQPQTRRRMKTRREVEAETMSPCGQPVAPAKSLTLMPTAARFGTVGGEITGAWTVPCSGVSSVRLMDTVRAPANPSVYWSGRLIFR